MCSPKDPLLCSIGIHDINSFSSLMNFILFLWGLVITIGLVAGRLDMVRRKYVPRSPVVLENYRFYKPPELE